MAVFLVTYDIRNKLNAAGLAAAIETLPWTRLTVTTYAVATTETDEELFHRLRPFAEDGDSLFVVLLKMPYRGMGPREVNYWLEERLRW